MLFLFLKKDSIELSHIEEVFKRVALINYQIDYTFHHNGRLLYDLHAGTLLERINQIYGQNYRERFFPVEENTDIVSIRGYVSKPEYARKSRGEQYLFVNHRFIKHPVLNAAVEKAYSDLIPDRYYPSYFLHLDVDPARIDVNIHPTKTEVKFVDENALFAILRAATKKALGQFSLASELQFNPVPEVDFAPAPKDYVPTQPQVHYNPDYNPFESKPAPAPRNHSSQPYHPTVERPKGSQWTSFFDIKNEDVATPTEHQTVIPDTPAPAAVQSSAAPCLQLANSYIVSTLSSGLLVVDQQAAHERVLYDRLMNQKQ